MVWRDGHGFSIAGALSLVFGACGYGRANFA
jgi:hypothetical protein